MCPNNAEGQPRSAPPPPVPSPPAHAQYLVGQSPGIVPVQVPIVNAVAVPVYPSFYLVGQPPAIVPIQAPIGNATGQWTTGLCGCLEDPLNCIVTMFFPCITFGQTTEIVERNTSLCNSCFCAGLMYFMLCTLCSACFYSYIFRARLRAQFSLPEEPCRDCLLHWCCGYCAICQEYRELNNRGLEPSIGWAANARRMNERGRTLVPPVMQGMPR